VTAESPAQVPSHRVSDEVAPCCGHAAEQRACSFGAPLTSGPKRVILRHIRNIRAELHGVNYGAEVLLPVCDSSANQCRMRLRHLQCLGDVVDICLSDRL
jgi:hypothetical protein